MKGSALSIAAYLTQTQYAHLAALDQIRSSRLPNFGSPDLAGKKVRESLDYLLSVAILTRHAGLNTNPFRPAL